MLLAGTGLTPNYMPELTWLPPNASPTDMGKAMNPDALAGLVQTPDGTFAYVKMSRFNAYLVSRDAISCTIQTLIMLALSSLAGVIGVSIYDHRSEGPPQQ